MGWIIGLSLAGIVLICAEVVVPGGVLGVIGACMLIAGMAMTYTEFGITGSINVLIINVVVLLLVLYFELKYLTQSKYGSRIILKSKIGGHLLDTESYEMLRDKEGEAETTLAPSGKIRILDKSYEAYSRDGHISKGERIRVVDIDNFRVIVSRVG